jgi:hypothetical protein
MKTFRRCCLALILCLLCCAALSAQTLNATQQVVLEGLRTSAAHGSFLAATYASDGSLLLLLDEHDGVRLLKSDATGTSLLAQSRLGTTGDSGTAIALDPSGNLYVTGTTSSGMLSGTAGAAFPAVADTSTNSFLAKYDSNLNLVFLTFLGAGRTSAVSVGATVDGAFVTGITFSPAFPVTAAGIQQVPASGTTENGFVERFTTDGSTLSYATYLTGFGGNTAPTALAVDRTDDVYVAGATSAKGYPTVSALQPETLGTNSGFLTKLNATGSAFLFSTFVAGNGITSMAFDAVTNSLLLTGNMNLGQFPVATVAMPLTSASYQTMLRIPTDGQSVTSSVLLVPGSQSFVTAGPKGDAWIAGALSTPLFPGDAAPDYSSGDSFLLHLTAATTFDQTLRLGGTVVNNPSYASLASTLFAPAVSGSTVMLPGTVTATISASLLSTQQFDLPFAGTPDVLLPNTLQDVVPTAATCGISSQCVGSGALLATITTATAAPSLSFSTGAFPNVTLRNLGSATATGVALSVTGFTMVSDCGATLVPSSQCSLALTGSGPGTLSVSAANASTATTALPTNTLSPAPLALSTYELDFGIVSAVDGAANQTLTVTNLSAASQMFSSAKDGGATTPYTFAESASDCASGGTAGVHVLAANSSCHITLGLTASSKSSNDGPARTAWKIGTRDITLTGFVQAAALNVSATEIDFGTQYSNTPALDLPRYLYLSNNSNTAVAHAAVNLSALSPFSVADACPSTLEPHNVCQITLLYLSQAAPSLDSATLALDDGITVLLTGQTLQPATATGSTVNPNLNVSSNTLSFVTPVVVTGISSTPQVVTLTNAGAAALAVSLAITGDFTFVSGCPSLLPASNSCTVQIFFAPSQPGARSGLFNILAGSGFAPAFVTLSGTGAALLPANNGTLALGQTLVGEPIVAWYKVQQALPSLLVSTASSQFGLALVEDTGNGHGNLPASSFAQSATSTCMNCWLGVQFLSQTAGAESATLTISSVANGNPYLLALTATALPVQGLLLTPSELDFGTVAVNNSTAPQMLTLANLLTSSAAATIQSVAVTGDFSIAPNTSGGAACSGALAATASCFVQIVFSPTATGDRTGTLTVVTSSGSVSSELTGYGEPDPGVAINPSALSFANTPGSGATQQTIALSNTGARTLAIGTPTSSDPSFGVASTCSTLSAGGICTLSVTFTPQTATVSAALSIPVTETTNGQMTTTAYSVPLDGSYTAQGAGLQILPGQVNFGAIATGSAGSTREFTLNNLTAKALNVTLSLPRQFPLATSGPCPTLAPAASCTFSVSFLPVTGGTLTGTVYAEGTPTDGSASVQTLTYMQGYGVATGKLSVSGGAIPNSPISFGQLTSGQTAQQTLVLTNTGSGSLTLRRISSAPPFLSTTSCGSKLAANATCFVTLTYAPIDEITANTVANPREDTGTLVLESDAISSPDTVTLTGIAIPVVSANPASSAVLDSFLLSESALTFPNTQVGSSSAVQNVTLTNNGSVTMHFLSRITAGDFTSTTTCGTLLPGATCTLAVSFTPTTASTSTVRSGTLEILSDSATSLEFISLIGASSAAPLTIAPTTLNFGTVTVGSNESLSVSVSNTSASPITFTGTTATGDYSAARGTCPANGSTLAGGSTCSLTVTFAPTAAGTRSGLLSLATDATSLPLTVSLTGVAVAGALQVTPGALAYGSIDVGSPATLTLTLLNTGTASVTGIANAIGGSNAGDFAVTSPCAISSLAPNQGCTELVTFTPAATGSRSAMLSIASSDPSGPVTIALSGTGVQAGSFVLNVNGGSSETVTVSKGSAASYPLTLTPLNGFSGSVALTCAALTAGQYASCSVVSSTLTISGSAQSATATINTVTQHLIRGIGTFALLLLVPAGVKRRRRLFVGAVMVFLLSLCLSATGCGGGPSSGGSSLLYTPSGTYQYQVTASSTSGTAVSSTVTLNLIVQ